MKYSIAATAALLATSHAATVTLQQTACIGSTGDLDSFEIEVGSLQQKDLSSVCGLKIASADGVDVNTVECQAFKDAEGKESGSAKFTTANPALISTNPVQEKSILCTAKGASSASGSATASGSTLVPSATGGSGPGSASPTGGSSGPGGSNSTSPSNTGSPSPTPSAPDNSNAAGRIGMGVGVIAAAFAVLLL